MDGAAGLKPLVVLGATGSIGTQTLEVAARLDCEIAGLAARRASRQFLDLAARFPEARLAVATEPEDGSIDGVPNRIMVGPDAVADLAATPDATVVNGIVGAAGLASTVSGLLAGNRVALANKESLVAGGPVVRAAAGDGGGEIVPIDSEHSALWQSLAGEKKESVRRLILTASGGPFRGRSAPELDAVTVAEALAHPTWDMGPRITVDSATLMNKALEVIEAHYLFEVDYDAIDVVVHPQSVVHSLIEFVDGSVKAELGHPDMRVPIQYALTWPERTEAPVESFDFTGKALTFEAPDRDAFPCLDLGYRAGRAGGSAPAVLNAADEVVVAAFLDGKIPFRAIPELVGRVLDELPLQTVNSVADVLKVDARARAAASELIAEAVLPG